MSSTSGERIRVLHVDDDPEFTDLVATVLERDDDRFTVETATSADEGLAVIGDRPPDCVVSDFEMPGMNGIELLNAVRESYPDLPFILFTGKGSEAIASDAISAGATDYLQKQSGTDHYELLANRIHNAVTQYRSERQLQKTQQEYAAVFENARNGLLLLDVEDDGFRFRRCNPRAVELSGLDRSELVGKTPREALAPENHKKVVGAYRKSIEQREPVEYTITLDHPAGRVVHESIVTPVTTDGEVEQLVVAFTDITERRTRQRELQDERAFIQQALDTLDDLFYVVDVDGNLRRWNDRVPDVTGYTESELADMEVTEFFPDEEREPIADAITATLADGRATVEADLLTADGQRIPYEFISGRLSDSDGKTTGLVGIGRDLTERRRRERRFRALVEESNDVVSVVDADGRFQYQSPSVERILGYDPGETVGDTAWEYIHPDDREAVTEAFEEWMANPASPVTVEYRARHADESWRWMEARGSDQTDNPAVEGYVVNSRDVTERKERRRELKRERQRYTTLFETLPNPVLHARAEHGELVVETVNPAFADTFGYDAETIAGESFHDYILPDDRADAAERLTRRIEDEEGIRTAVQRETTDGVRTFQLDIRIRSAEDGSTEGYAVYTDITERTEYERQLEAQNERLDEFASIVGHDLRNPLSVAADHLELARDACESDHLDRVAAAIDRGQTLIDDLLAVARAGQTVSAFEPVELADVARRSWQTAETGTAALEADTTLVIRADGGRLRQLLENLYRNAVEHGGDEVTVAVGEVDDGFYVADTGPGIPEADRDELFDARYSSAENGTGLGLWIVERVADAHGWSVAVTDSECGGARFEFTGVEVLDR